MKLADLRKSFSEMPYTEKVETIKAIRAKRRAPPFVTLYKQKMPKAKVDGIRRVSKIKSAVSSMTKEQKFLLLKELAKTPEGQRILNNMEKTNG